MAMVSRFSSKVRALSPRRLALLSAPPIISSTVLARLIRRPSSGLTALMGAVESAIAPIRGLGDSRALGAGSRRLRVSRNRACRQRVLGRSA